MLEKIDILIYKYFKNSTRRIHTTMYINYLFIVTDGTKKSIEAVVKDFDTFSLLSGLKLKRKKNIYYALWIT